MSALIPINNVNVCFEVVDDEVFTTSLQIAQVFKKRHDHILRLIQKLPNDEFKSLNFKYDSYFDKKGEQRKAYNLTRDGFSLLVMGFTGEKAYQWKVDFIKAFNMMFDELKRLKFSQYVDEIEKLKKDKVYVINGYKSQIVQHNAKINSLKNVSAVLAQVRDERDFFKKEYLRTYEALGNMTDFDALNQVMQRGMYMILDDTKKKMYQLSTELTLKFNKK